MQNCKICCLYSGSKGNCTLVSAGGANILIDAGRSAKALCLALCQIGWDISMIDAIFITHDHKDHTSALATLSHKHKIPIHMLLQSAQIFNGLCDERLCENLVLYRGNGFETDIKGLHIKAFPVPHDSLAAVGYRISYIEESGETVSLAVSTDTGHVTDTMLENLTGCSAVVIESNHDLEMLKNGPYPYELKKRIASKYGHLSNADCAILASQLHAGGTKHMMLAHLSEENNLPALAYNEVFTAIADPTVNLKVAEQNAPVWLLDGSETKQELPEEYALWLRSDS